MKITPITNNNISSRGSVNYNINKLLYNYPSAISRQVKLIEKCPQKFTFLPAVLSAIGLDVYTMADNIKHNLEVIMSRFDKSCELVYQVSEKNPANYLFAIKSNNSDHVEICGTLNLEGKNYRKDFGTIDKFVNDNLAKINPYEANLKFKTMSRVWGNFAPEKEVWFIEDELVDMNTGVINPSEFNGQRVTYGTLLDEMGKFEEQFGENVVDIF